MSPQGSGGQSWGPRLPYRMCLTRGRGGRAAQLRQNKGAGRPKGLRGLSPAPPSSAGAKGSPPSFPFLSGGQRISEKTKLVSVHSCEWPGRPGLTAAQSPRANRSLTAPCYLPSLRRTPYLSTCQAALPPAWPCSAQLPFRYEMSVAGPTPGRGCPGLVPDFDSGLAGAYGLRFHHHFS